MITPLSGNNSTENGLLTYILCQLKQCSVHLFQEYIKTLHVAFQEGKHLTMTPTTLLSNVEDKIRALKHASEWTIDEAVSTPAMALVSTSAPPSVLKELLKQQTSLLSKPLENRKVVKTHIMIGNTRHLLIFKIFVDLMEKYSAGAPSATTDKGNGLLLMTQNPMWTVFVRTGQSLVVAVVATAKVILVILPLC